MSDVSTDPAAQAAESAEGSADRPPRSATGSSAVTSAHSAGAVESALFMQDLDDRRVPLSAGMIARWMMKAGMDSDPADHAASQVVAHVAAAHNEEVRAAVAGGDAATVRRDEVFGPVVAVMPLRAAPCA